MSEINPFGELLRSYPGGLSAIVVDAKVPYTSLRRLAFLEVKKTPWDKLRRIAAAKGWDGHPLAPDSKSWNRGRTTAERHLWLVNSYREARGEAGSVPARFRHGGA